VFVIKQASRHNDALGKNSFTIIENKMKALIACFEQIIVERMGDVPNWIFGFRWVAEYSA
jgi:hypothetical protein